LQVELAEHCTDGMFEHAPMLPHALPAVPVVQDTSILLEHPLQVFGVVQVTLGLFEQCAEYAPVVQSPAELQAVYVPTGVTSSW
jgi:hypothetical protein